MIQSHRPTGPERRARKRELASFPAHVQIDDKKRSAIVRDVSAEGANLLTRARLVERQWVKLLLYITDSRVPTETYGKVVRLEMLSAENSVWPCSAGIQFDAPLEELEPLIERLAARQAKLAGSGAT